MPAYVWTCHRCRQANQPQHNECAHCGFAAVAPGNAIIAARVADPAEAPTKSKSAPISEKCPRCATLVQSHGDFFGGWRYFSCTGCTAGLKSNAPLLNLLMFAVWIPLVFLSYQRWPSFTFFGGDFLLMFLAGALVWPFHRVVVIGEPDAPLVSLSPSPSKHGENI